MGKIAGITLALLAVILLGAWLKLRGPDIPYETLEARYAKADSRYVDLFSRFAYAKSLSWDLLTLLCPSLLFSDLRR